MVDGTGGARVVRAALARGLLLTAVLAGLTGCGEPEHCDEGAVAAVRTLGTPDGVTLDLRPSEGIGCTDTVPVPDPRAVLDYYAEAMTRAGWHVERTEDGVVGTTAGAGLTVGALEGDDVGFYVSGPDDLP
ncbi:hypothetical protein [Phycicoccus flavus]|uniref:hypothetical protein n=1 Tax=Phycicoccus flavus TaxID=2502783 RepID=UPI000FEBB5CB|nr:hypothetical protein [Phycicoccus flavus]NHA70027.1 hypothetical protein [Phycicoccus flavus]